jgi:tRNA (guanine-N7-)-methyltransferase
MSQTAEQSPIRKIRSFIRRQGRITPGQQAALEQHWNDYCLNPEHPLNPLQVFNRDEPLILEIGFGNGECLAEMAAANPENNHIGIEVHKPGVGHLIVRLEQQRLSNVRIYCHDAIEILEHCIADNSLSGVHLFFADPWPKKKHHKRRIVQPDFVDLIARKLVPGGYFHAATDWEHYAEHMLSVLSSSALFTNAHSAGSFSPRPAYRPLTKFEQRGLRLGHSVWDLIFIKNQESLPL